MFGRKRNNEDDVAKSLSADVPDVLPQEENSPPGDENSLAVEGDEAAQPTDAASDVKEDKKLSESFRQWLEEQGYSEDRCGLINNRYAELLEKFRNGDFKGELFPMLVRDFDFEDALKEAEMRGELKGRNSAIEELTQIYSGSDGIPHPGASAGITSSRYAPSIFDLARDAM
ncbi:MAG: hypothetical protein NC204_02590 [Candidatus Amulumruptor caecigallinarius]|nr:hypothetical protein [Candidatus Amulumruptor caecigallinarius]